MKWTNQAWENILPVYQSILNLPFNTQLSSGLLKREQFLFYLAQDAYYLIEFARALSTIGGKMHQAEYVKAFAGFSTGAIAAEQNLHESFFIEFGLPAQVKPSPSTLLYTSYILNQVAYESVEVAVAAVLPCFWVYKEVGLSIFSSQNGSVNPYKRWINMYAGEDFGQAVNQIIGIADELADRASDETRNKMFEAFEMATRLEWMFWDSAYQLEEWKI